MEQPRVITGMERFRRVTGHSSGSVALTLVPLTTDSGGATLGIGSHGAVFGGIESTITEQRAADFIGASAFINSIQLDQSDARSANYLDRISMGARINRLDTKTSSDLIVAHSYSKFGAQGFYGAAPHHPAEETLKNSMILGSLKLIEDEEQPAAIGAAWWRSDDD
ncbi:MAG: hypothetical protein RBT40_11815, partial [Petrimonas sp.]|nr:hypothetical protein [Petrimonas sp.]